MATNPILAAAQSAQTQMANAGTEIAEARQSQAELSTESANLQVDIGLNNQIIEGAKNQAALATQNARLKAGAIFGADLNQQGEQISKATAIWQSAYERQLASAQAIEEKDKVAFTDNPLQYIVNQFTINQDIEAHNAALKVKNVAKEHIEEINALSNATAVNQSNFSQSITQASVDAASKNTLNTALIQANQAKIASLGYNVEGLKDAVNMSKEALGVMFNVQSMQNQQAQLKLAMDNYALHKEEFKWKQDEHAAQEATDEYLVGRIQKGLESMYGDKAPNLQANPKLAKQYLTLMKSNTPAGKEAVDAYMAGGASGVLGGNSGQVIDMMKSGINLQFTPAQEPIKQLLSASHSEFVGSINAGVTAKPSNAAEFNRAVSSVVENKVNAMLKNVKPGDGDNIFNIGAVDQLLKMPGVADTALTQKVLGPAATAGVKFDDPKQVYATVTAALEKKQISINEAVEGITALYQKGVKTNLETRQLTKFGIPLPTNMPYNTGVVVDPYSLLGGTEVVNLTDKNQVTRALMKTTSSLFSKINPLEMGMRAGNIDYANMPLPKAGEQPDIYNPAPEYWERYRAQQAGTK